ncbi:MAG: ACP S-malonyltransferase [Spirochaetia bacterium]|jgi:[acyl-carrier-protein] S-malonyltransferase|nr:ACP S-malonyltransferase [Spirochaetia bacterium]
MVNIIALYPGQGSQYPKMALDLYAASQKVRELFELASEVTHTDLHTLLDTGTDEDLKRTEITQLVVTLANRAANIRLSELGHTILCHSGLSLGELTAYASGGIIDDATLFQLVQKRSHLMAEAGMKVEEKYGKLGMAAVIGMDYASVQETLTANALTDVYPSNDNGPNQVVIAGLEAAIQEAKSHLIAGGARRVLPLKVSGAFHTPFMQEATEEFSAYLDSLAFNDPNQRIISSVTAEEVLSCARAKELLGMQLANPVRWTKVMQAVSAIRQSLEDTKKAGHIVLAEVGPGTVLTGLWKNSGLPDFCTPLGKESEIQSMGEET